MGDIQLNRKDTQMLYLELTSWENRGITIWLDGCISDSRQVSDQVYVSEENTYMRDYIFDKGVLTEIHFDKIEKEPE